MMSLSLNVYLLRSLAESVAVLILSPRSAMLSLRLSVHLYGGLPTLRVPLCGSAFALDGSRSKCDYNFVEKLRR